MVKSHTPNSSNYPYNGHLYLIPTPLGHHPENQVLPGYVIDTIHSITTFFAERIRQTSSFLRWINHPVPDFKCRFYELNKNTRYEDLFELLSLLKDGVRAGLISDAGCPAVADPGSQLVRLAHKSGIRVTPLVGPSSILLAVMASGLNGQAFTFHGYLPKPGKARTERIRQLQIESSRTSATQVFMETPFRNNDLIAELIHVLPDDTLLCAATNLTLPQEQILTRKVAEWRMHPADLADKPSIFLLLATGNKTNAIDPSEKKASVNNSSSRPSHVRTRKKKPTHKRKWAQKK